MDELTSTFVNESRDQLTAMEDGLLKLEQSPDDADNLGAIFRAAHTIKGGAGVVECRFIEAFTHKVENVLDKLRNGEIPVSGELSTVMLACCDHLGALLDVLAAGLPQPDAAVQARGDALLATLTAQFLGGSLPAEDERHIETSGGGVVTTDAWHLSVRFGPGVLKNGVDPLSLLHYLTSLGEITHLTTLADTLPAADAMDPECCYLGFEIGFQTRASKAQIEQVFDFVRDECTLHILPPHSKIDEYMQLIKESPEDPMRLGEILVYSGALTQAELDTGLAAQSRAAVESDTLPPRPIGAILVEQKVVHSELVEAAASRQTVISEKKTREARMIRVHADKLDQLIDLVGEMVIAGASTYLLAQRSGRSELIESTAVLRRLVENIRDSALQLRMVPIGETFNRFQRVVRDNARELGKTIDLVIIDGFLTGVGPASYVVPLDSVVEYIELGEVSASRNYLNLRGEVLPFVRLRKLFGIGGEIPDRQNVVIVQYAGEKAGLVVDTLLGEFQTVIKPLGVLFKHLRGIGGSTILGTGEVALILDVPALVGLVTRLEERRLTAPPAAERLAHGTAAARTGGTHETASTH